ncbi:hypothetical protein CGLO_08168 [Colletotrichum gloeosporioides Cg-14]|uniref:Uncharacterized protein n=1 Tax=Colletotrichum gloeosporioides (strain Cg-14) TaxID=1237896 RepID=T0LKQ2_COLGC|nr:hypothetical protein CGLO_08168 [Colletotrichum gloeosporioides Cg-14]
MAKKPPIDLFSLCMKGDQPYSISQ